MIIPGQIYEGTTSWFGGIEDEGVMKHEGLALYELPDAEKRPDLFIPYDPVLKLGLAKRLQTDKILYCAMRWDYAYTPKEILRKSIVHVWRVNCVDQKIRCIPTDWGPNEKTGRIIDLSRLALMTLNLPSDDFPVKCLLETP